MLPQIARPLILITNDDGIYSPGLRSAVRGVRHIAEVIIAAPSKQQSGTGRSFVISGGEVRPVPYVLEGEEFLAYAISATPAPTVRRALLTLTPRRPDLVISGINYGENLGTGITVSGTIGAAIEAATFGIPALAISLETDPKHHMSISDDIDFSHAAYFCELFSRRLLQIGLPAGVDFLKVDIPMSATRDTPWSVVRVSRQQYYHSVVGKGLNGEALLTGYARSVDMEKLEADSDVHAMFVKKIVAVSPITIDLTAPVSLEALEQQLRDGAE